MEIFKVFGSIFIDNDPANRKLDDTDSRAGKVGQTLVRTAQTAARWGAAIAAGAAVAGSAMLALATRTARSSGELVVNAQRAGVTTDAYQDLRYALTQVGVSEGDVSTALQRLNQRIGQAEEGSTKYGDALRRLRVSTRDASGEIRDSDRVFMDLVTRLHEVEDSQTRAALAADIFGVNLSQRLLPAIEAGGDELANLRNRAHELGIVLDEDGLKAGSDFASMMDEVWQMLGAVRDRIMISLMPTLRNWLQWVVDNIPKIGPIFEFIGEVIEIVIRHTKRVLEPFVDLFERIFGPVWEWTIDIFGKGWDWLTNTTWAEKWEDIKGWMEAGWDWTVDTAGKAWDWLTETTWKEKWDDIKTWMTDGWRWIVDTVGEGWDWLDDRLPWLTDALRTLKDLVVGGWNWSVDIAGEGWEWLKDWLDENTPEELKELGKAVLNVVVEPAGALYRTIKEGFDTGDWSGIWGVTADVWRAGVKIGVSLYLAAGTATMLLNSITSGLGLIGAGATSLASFFGLPGVIGAVSIAVAVMEAMEESDYEKLAQNIVDALIFGFAAAGLTGSPAAGMLVFTIMLNAEIGSKAREKLDEFAEGGKEWVDEFAEDPLHVVPAADYLDALGEGWSKFWSWMGIGKDKAKEDIDELDDAFEELHDNVVGNSYIPDMVTAIGVWLGERLESAMEPALGFIDRVDGAFYDLYDNVVGNSYVPTMMEEIGDAFERLKEKLADPVVKYTVEALEAFEDLDEGTTDLMLGMAERMASIMDTIVGRVEQMVGDVTQLFFSGTASWSSILEVFGSAVGSIFTTIVSSVAQELATSILMQDDWLAKTLANIGTSISAYISQAYASLLAFYGFLGPGAPIAAGATVAAGIAAIASLGGAVIRGIMPGAPSGGGGASGGGSVGGGGHRVSEITGPTRDLLIDLLTPLASLNALTGIGERIYNLLDDRMPFAPGMEMAGAAPAGGSTVRIEQINVYPHTASADDITDDTIAEIDRKLRERWEFHDRGEGRRG